jgi:hypothetical protein
MHGSRPVVRQKIRPQLHLISMYQVYLTPIELERGGKGHTGSTGHTCISGQWGNSHMQGLSRPGYTNCLLPCSMPVTSDPTSTSKLYSMQNPSISSSKMTSPRSPHLFHSWPDNFAAAAIQRPCCPRVAGHNRVQCNTITCKHMPRHAGLHARQPAWATRLSTTQG